MGRTFQRHRFLVQLVQKTLTKYKDKKRIEDTPSDLYLFNMKQKQRKDNNRFYLHLLDGFKPEGDKQVQK